MSRTQRIFTIAPSAPFIPALARALYDGRIISGFDGGDPLRFCTATVFLPNRRSCRLMRQAFLDISRNAMLLPRLVPLGDVDDDETSFSEAVAPVDLAPPVPPFERHLLLARLVQAFGEALRPAESTLASADAPIVAATPLDALALAGELMDLMDQVSTEHVPWSNLSGIVDAQLDRYWQLTRRFLDIASQAWPEILAARGEQDAATHRDARLQAEAERLMQAEGPFIAAGSTGSILATRDLLKAIAGHPHGAVVLPGFNTDMDDAEWASLMTPAAQMQGHPQYGLARLVRHLGVGRGDVMTLAAPLLPERDRFVRIAMRTTATTDLWHEEAQQISAGALDGLTLIEAAHEQEEALACALVLRALAEDTGSTAALITPDRALAHRIMAELDRWNVAYDDSGGEPLGGTAAGVLARLAARLATQEPAAADMLALLLHPALAGTAELSASAVAAIDLLALRGLKDRRTLADLGRNLALPDNPRRGDPRARLTQDNIAAARTALAWLEAALAPLAALAAPAPLPAFAAAHLLVIKALAPKAGTHGLSELVEAMGAVAACSDSGFLIEPQDYAAAFDTVVGSLTVRRTGAEGAPIRILGLPEARLLHADCVVLAGLVEGGWPMQPRLDPWLNRAMRQNFGIDPPERRIGLAAHDFVQALGNPRVILSRSAKINGVPSVASRWLQRLSAVAGEARWAALQATGTPWLRLARALDANDRPQAAKRPAPCPPLHLRPKKLSVTEIETLQRDPYAIYARHVLRLVPLDPYDMPIGAAERGSLIHDALHRFIAETEQKGWPDDPMAALEAHGRLAFAAYWDIPDVRGFWWPRFLRIAAWFLAFENGRKAEVKTRFSERWGEMHWQTAAAEMFMLHARADRIDVLHDGTIEIIDYKTGAPPGNAEVLTGLSPQLPLEAAIVASGGFVGIPPLPSHRLTYLRLSGLEPAGEVKSVTPAKDMSVPSLVEETLAELKTLIDAYDNPAQPYLSWVMPQRLARYGGHYDHLARVAEWSMSEGGGE